MDQVTYALGHTQPELDRLINQARYFGDLTAHVLRLAGLAPGMRVLDIGCGAGDISFLAASIVGREGSVTGVDKSPEAVALATQRATAAGLTNVQFITQDVSTYEAEKPFDALIGSLILMYFSDPAVILRRLAEFVRPGGVIAFQEMDMYGAKAAPPCPLFDLSMERMRQTFSRAGTDLYACLKLTQIFEEAGLPAPQMIQGARVESGAEAAAYHQIERVLRSLLPLMERTGVATAAEVDVETLAERLRQEALAVGATMVAPPLIGAWTRKEAAR
jgi:ubiquinone/menaquinone biosynthesis C-methylase UbiE